ncbi:hypothetical protein DINM_001154 [Dirofilaria immitis]|nr:hypothetical protein [Dirofilaria immitis]
MDRWGMDCMNECKCASDRKLCNPVTGICHCAHGLMGDLCDKYCPDGSWGPDCAFRCSCEMKNSKCQAITGDCVCHPGFTGPHCDQACPEGFGVNSVRMFAIAVMAIFVIQQLVVVNKMIHFAVLQYHASGKNSVMSTVVSIVSIMIVITISLSILVIHYRRKYMKERDPTVPTITYIPTMENNNECILTRNEFNNPLYQRTIGSTVNDQFTMKDSKLEYQMNNERSDKLQNGCVKFDDIYAEIESSLGSGKLQTYMNSDKPGNSRNR